MMRIITMATWKLLAPLCLLACPALVAAEEASSQQSNLASEAAAIKTPAESAKDAEFNWEPWRHIATQHEGRMKPFDTHAREVVTSIAGREKLKPEDYSAIAFTDIADWNDLAKQLTSAQPGSKAAAIAERLPSHLLVQLKETDLNTEALKTQVSLLRSELDAKRPELERKWLKLLPTLTDMKEAAQANHDEAILEKFKQLYTAEEKLIATESIKDDLVKDLNKILSDPNLYDAKRWPKESLPEVVATKLSGDAKPLSPADLALVNRALISAAFDNTIAVADYGNTKFGPARLPTEIDAIPLYVTWLMTWQGWDKNLKANEVGGQNAEMTYWKNHDVDAWDALPLFDARFQQMAAFLKPETDKHVSARTIRDNDDFRGQAGRAFQLRMADEVDLKPTEEKLLTVFNNYQTYLLARQGLALVVGPNYDPESQDWFPLASVLLDGETAQKYDSSLVAQVRAGFFKARQGLIEDNAALFNQGTEEFTSSLQKLGSTSKLYPATTEINREVFYNQLHPFKRTWQLAALAAAFLAISLGVKSRIPFGIGYIALLAAMSLMAYGMYLRIMISGRGPVTNIFETIIWSGFVASTLAVVLGAVYRTRVIPMAAAVTVLISTLLADSIPANFGSSIEPLQPVLRSNFWLVVHVMTIVASYGAFLLAWVFGNIGLTYYVFGKDTPEAIKPMATFSYRAVQVGVLLLTTGTILGGWWAADSWGRFWGWDPKEVWALIGILGYLAVLHARFVGLVKQFGILAWSVICFALIVMSWYGVNYLLGAGLHAYASGSVGGQREVVGLALVNLAYVGVAYFRYRSLRATRGVTAAATKTTPERKSTTEPAADFL